MSTIRPTQPRVLCQMTSETVPKDPYGRRVFSMAEVNARGISVTISTDGASLIIKGGKHPDRGWIESNDQTDDTRGQGAPAVAVVSVGSTENPPPAATEQVNSNGSFSLRIPRPKPGELVDIAASGWSLRHGLINVTGAGHHALAIRFAAP